MVFYLCYGKVRPMTFEIVLLDDAPPPVPTSHHRAFARLYALRELRALCKRHGLPATGGTKHDLAARLGDCKAFCDRFAREAVVKV